MEKYEIVWTSRAKKDLRKVYNFYTELAGEAKAFEIVENLLERLDLLADERFVKIGVVDEQFQHLKYDYKKIIETNMFAGKHNRRSAKAN